MTTQTKPTSWDRAAMFGRWLRDKFAILFVTSWLYLLGWTIVLGAFAVLLYLDGKFSYNLAVGSSIAPAAFMAMGFAFRFFAAVFLMASERSRMLAKAERNDWPEAERTRLLKRRKPQEWERRGKVWRRIGLSISVLVCLHAIGIGLEALSHKRDTAQIEQQFQDNLTASTELQVATLEKQKSEIRADLKLKVDPLTEEIRRLDTDGKVNEELADEQKAQRKNFQESAAVRIAAIDSQIQGILFPESDEEAEQQARDRAEASEADEWAPLFIGIAQAVTQNRNPSDWAIYLCAVAFIVFWVLNAEGIVIFIPKELMKMHMQDAIAAAKDAERREASERAKKGWETRKEAEESEREQLQIDDGPYWSLMIMKALNNGMPKRTVKGTMRTFFSSMEPNAVRLRLNRFMDARLELPKGFYKDGKGDVKRADRAIERGFLSEERPTYLMQEHIDYILMEGEYAPKKKADEEPKPKQAENGKDHSTELTLPELGADDADRPAA